MTPHTPGYRTTEFWMTLGIHLLTLLIASGLLPADSQWEKLAALLLSGLTQASYNAARAKVKAPPAPMPGADVVNVDLAPAPPPSPASGASAMAKPGLHTLILFAALSGLVLGTGGCASRLANAVQPPAAAYVAADRATYEAVAPEYVAYVQADPLLSADERDRRARTIRTWILRLERAEAAIEAAPAPLTPSTPR